MKGYPSEVRFHMHWSEMDALGHANNARFFTWFETSRVETFGALRDTLPPGVGPILATTSCTFHRPVVHPAELVVGSRIAKIGRTSFHWEHAVALAGAPDDPVATGHAIVVMVRYDTGESVPIPESLKAALAPLVVTPD